MKSGMKRQCPWNGSLIVSGQLDEDDTMTPTERELMAEVGDERESE